MFYSLKFEKRILNVFVRLKKPKVFSKIIIFEMLLLKVEISKYNLNIVLIISIN